MLVIAAGNCHRSVGGLSQHPSLFTLRRTTTQPQRGLRTVVYASSTNGSSTAPPILDASIRVKLSLAEGSGKLDLSECDLTEVPPQVFELRDLEELSLAGNKLTSLPPEIGQLSSLRLLQLSGNQLTSLPDEIGELGSLEGFWVHGNLLTHLPETLGGLKELKQLSIAGNALGSLPDSIAALTSLNELAASGNRLCALPEEFGALAALVKLQLHGNRLESLPRSSLQGLVSLKEMWLQGNPRLTSLPAELGTLPALQQLSAADCGLENIASSVGHGPALRSLALYGNRLTMVPPELVELSSNLGSLWLESNPLEAQSVNALLTATSRAEEHFKALGLDARQLQQDGVLQDALLSAGSRIKTCETYSQGRPGYMKLVTASGMTSTLSGESAKVLVVAFGSAPGVPNWGGILRRVKDAAESPDETNFDILYVVDPVRGWYGGGNDAEFKEWEARIAAVANHYPDGVVMIGDSMGASAALMFAGLATSVHAFCPQVDLTTSSIRPAQDDEWFAVMRRRIEAGVASCRGKVTVHVGNWKHDLSQVNLLPQDNTSLQVQLYSLDSHRLAAALDVTGKLLPLLRQAILNELGLSGRVVRIANLF